MEDDLRRQNGGSSRQNGDSPRQNGGSASKWRQCAEPRQWWAKLFLKYTFLSRKGSTSGKKIAYSIAAANLRLPLIHLPKRNMRLASLAKSRIIILTWCPLIFFANRFFNKNKTILQLKKVLIHFGSWSFKSQDIAFSLQKFCLFI